MIQQFTRARGPVDDDTVRDGHDDTTGDERPHPPIPNDNH